MSETFDLWEDVPYPMPTFLPILDLIESTCIIQFLSLYKSLQVIMDFSPTQCIHKALRQADILQLQCTNKELRYLLIMIASDATAHTSDQEEQVRMILGKSNESFDSLLHFLVLAHMLAIIYWYGIALALQSFSLTPYSAKLLTSCTRGATCMIAQRITAKHEDLLG